MSRMGRGHGVDDGSDLVGRLVDLAPDVECRTSGWREIRATTSFTAASNAGVPAVAVRLWIRTFSAAGRLKPSCRIRSIRPDSPGPVVFGLGVFVPTMPPIPKATTTMASQPNVAVFQWFALQRPMRAARLRGLRSWVVLGDTVVLLSVAAVRRRSQRGGGTRRVHARASCELAARCGGEHDSSLRVGAGERTPGHGISTSLTLVAVVRAAT
jgi:hypothetical protein